MMFTDNDCLNIKRQIIKKISIISKLLDFSFINVLEVVIINLLLSMILNWMIHLIKKNGSILFEFLERYWKQKLYDLKN